MGGWGVVIRGGVGSKGAVGRRCKGGRIICVVVIREE